ncbi:MAG TPA: phosphotransferase [Gemmataceae bacterium]|nr:phosphotransferase [Gemmataceae bacterium]
MPEPPAGEVVTTGLRDHPAIRAWAGLRPERVEPERIDVLKGRKGSARRSAYRLVGVGPGGSAVIAKRYRRAKGLLERAVYEEVLPHLPLTRPHYYGCVEDSADACCWLFLEDVGSDEYAASLAEHRRLAGRWLGRLHSLAARVAPVARWPDLGPGHYLQRLRSARDRIGDSLGNPALGADDRDVLGEIRSDCGALEEHWGRVEAACADMPRTLTHGDFAPKNIRVRAEASGLVLLPFDWGNAGWGVPAVDLAQALVPARGFAANPDLAAYAAAVRDAWPGADLPAVERWAVLGTLFRSLVAITWEARGLTTEWVDQPMARLPIYQAALTQARQSGDWE